MNIGLSDNANPNYVAKIVEIRNLRKHEDADRLEVTTIDGNNIITGIGNVAVGDCVVYFPLECTISSKFLKETNSYRDSSLNKDETQKGFFEQTGRVKPVKLRGERSEGYMVPISVFSEYSGISVEKLRMLRGSEFDLVNHEVFVKKYVIKEIKTPATTKNRGPKKELLESKLVENQFRFHDDTSQLGKNMHIIKPESDITITWKMHGTSFVSSNLIVKRQLKWYEKALMNFGVRIETTEYGNIYSSRKVIKNEHLSITPNSYYRDDVWGAVNNILFPQLHKGETVYGEIVGFTQTGQAIQKGYDYGRLSSDPKPFDIYIYRITQTNADGKVFELSYKQLSERCLQLGEKSVPLLYSGKANGYLEYVPGTDIRDWQDAFLEKLRKDYVHDQNSIFCKNIVPEEGICLRIEKLTPVTFKLKSFAFLTHESKQLDEGVSNLEDEQSQ